ncbi:MAG TPA: hypothetical protein VGL86_25060 [Polyangia bacterium]
MRSLLVAILAASAAGCGDDADSAPDMAVVACRGSLSGVVSETILDCRVTWDETSGTAVIGNDGDLTVSDPSQIVTGNTFGFGITVDGDARTGPLSSVNVDSYSGGVQLPSDGGVLNYIANFSNQIHAPPNVGVMSANLTAVTVDFTNATESQWIVHGTVSATFVPINSDGTPAPTTDGTIQLALDF